MTTALQVNHIASFAIHFILAGFVIFVLVALSRRFDALKKTNTKPESHKGYDWAKQLIILLLAVILIVLVTNPFTASFKGMRTLMHILVPLSLVAFVIIVQVNVNKMLKSDRHLTGSNAEGDDSAAIVAGKAERKHQLTMTAGVVNTIMVIFVVILLIFPVTEIVDGVQSDAFRNVFKSYINKNNE